MWKVVAASTRNGIIGIIVQDPENVMNLKLVSDITKPLEANDFVPSDWPAGYRDINVWARSQNPAIQLEEGELTKEDPAAICNYITAVVTGSTEAITA